LVDRYFETRASNWSFLNGFEIYSLLPALNAFVGNTDEYADLLISNLRKNLLYNSIIQ
jgi:hypothetical protein